MAVDILASLSNLPSELLIIIIGFVDPCDAQVLLHPTRRTEVPNANPSYPPHGQHSDSAVGPYTPVLA
jgi:hypothetical protein